MTTGPGTSGRDGGLNLQTAISALLPTPRASDGEKGRPNQRGSSGDPMLLSVIAHLVARGGVDWGKYAPAIHRWEAIHGPHPFPATLGPLGGLKPAPEFVEWMMALPAGHVTSVPDLTINALLKLLGNGVVPAQAERALRCLTSDALAFDSKENEMTSTDTSSFFTTRQTRDVPRDQYGRYKLPGPDGEDMSWTRATTFAATMAEQYGLSIWHQRQVAWGFGRRPDLVSMLSTIAGPEDKKALGEIVAEAHIAAGTQAKANRGTAIHTATAAAERDAFEQVPDEFRPHVASYLAELKRYRLQVLPEFIERTVVVPEYDVAGTFDNLVLCPDGRHRVLDKKTGREDYSDIEFAIQMSLYANASAMFNYDTGRYEPLPEIATDYAILAHIDPESGRCELKRINIQWGWEWCRTAAEVRAIRKTKHVITPLIPPTEEADTLAPPNVTALPEFIPRPDGLTEEQRHQQWATNGHAVLSGVPSVFEAFWSDTRHDIEPDPDETVNGVPLAEYGRSSSWPCAHGEVCVLPTLNHENRQHPDGTVCLASTPVEAAPQSSTPPPYVITAQTEVVSADVGTIGAPEMPPGEVTPDDEMVAKIIKQLKTKAAVQNVARALMETVGIKEADPDGIRLNQYKEKLANQIVTLAFSRSTEVPGFGKPSGPGNTAGDKKSGGKKTAAPDTSVEDKAREVKIRTAVASIRAAVSLEQLQELHTHYSTKTEIGWTDEMQNAARTRAVELDQDSGDSPLTPLEMIQGATSRETLTKAWNLATKNGSEMIGWTEELNDAALTKQRELSEAAAVATSGNQ